MTKLFILSFAQKCLVVLKQVLVSDVDCRNADNNKSICLSEIRRQLLKVVSHVRIPIRDTEFTT